jgi:GT2 family glycosyltransferase
VIPVHNRREFTRNCLAALDAQTCADFRTIVVDDGSTDGSARMIRASFPRVRLLKGDGNLWWAEAMNRGIRRALTLGARRIVCLNDDTLPPPDFIANLLASAAWHPETIVGARAVDHATGETVFDGERMHWLFAAPVPLSARDSEVADVTHSPGRGLLIPAAVFSRIGLFDSARFPQYAADYDFTHRARRAGFRVIRDPHVILRVFPEASGDAAHRARKSWANYRKHLFDRRGGGNLRVFLRYALRNCPLLLLPVCLPVGLARRIGGYLLEWIAEGTEIQTRKEHRHARGHNA